MPRDAREGAEAQVKAVAILAAGAALTASTASEAALGASVRAGAFYSGAILILLFAVLLPARLAVLSVPLTLVLLAGTRYVNEIKIAAVGLPITFLDLQMTLTEPGAAASAMGLRPVLAKAAAVGGILIGAITLAVVLALRRRCAHRRPRLWRAWSRDGGAPAAVSMAVLIVILGAGRTVLVRHGEFVRANLTTLEPELWLESWTPESQSALSRRIGVLEYVAFTYAAGDAEVPSGAAPPPGGADVTRAARTIVPMRFGATRPLLPNIVFFHAESTFDPNVSLRLLDRVDLPLWSRSSRTRALGPLRVNVVGGGSWVTEFEVLTGVDSRIFGFQGFYTHHYVAPTTRNTFVLYLARKGYRTAAYSAVDGHFSNTENAFKTYGFQRFMGGPELRLPSDWNALVDRDVIEQVVHRGAFTDAGPFFYYIGTNENHGPHPCRNFAAAAQFITTFEPAASFAQNCALNEYLRRARSTSDAFTRVAEELTRVEKRTGRPFVLLAYGDHQPWSFTDGLYSVAGGTAVNEGIEDFSALRTGADDHLTFFHLVTSDAWTFDLRLDPPPPATLLPSIVSALIANSSDDLYLPVNFLAYATCGSDFRRSDCALYPQIGGWLRYALRTPAAPRRE